MPLGLTMLVEVLLGLYRDEELEDVGLCMLIRAPELAGLNRSLLVLFCLDIVLVVGFFVAPEPVGEVGLLLLALESAGDGA